MAHGNNKPSTSTYARSNSNDISSAITKNFDFHVTISIEDKRPFPDDNTNGHRLENSENPVLRSHQKILPASKVQKEMIAEKPVIERSSKPTALKTYNPRCKEVLRFMKELNELAISKSKLANELSGQEYELYSEREECLCAKIKFLKVKLEDTHKMYLKVENEYKMYLKETDTIKFNPTDDHEKENLELFLSLVNKEIKDTETKRKKLHDEFLQRENKKTKQIDSDIHKEPLRTDGASINISLKRSYSSPNLLQLGDHKRPRIDEVSSKSENQEEQVTPVHGNADQQQQQPQQYQQEQRQERPQCVPGQVYYRALPRKRRTGHKARARRNARRMAEWMARK